jgi:hypothetical protein
VGVLKSVKFTELCSFDSESSEKKILLIEYVFILRSTNVTDRWKCLPPPQHGPYLRSRSEASCAFGIEALPLVLVRRSWQHGLGSGRPRRVPDEDSFGPEWVTTGPGKFIASMRDLIKAFRTEQGAVQDQEVIKSLLKPDADGQMVIPLLRAMPKLMAESQETGVPVVAMTRDWWLNTIKPQI